MTNTGNNYLTFKEKRIPYSSKTKPGTIEFAEEYLRWAKNNQQGLGEATVPKIAGILLKCEGDLIKRAEKNGNLEFLLRYKGISDGTILGLYSVAKKMMLEVERPIKKEKTLKPKIQRRHVISAGLVGLEAVSAHTYTVSGRDE